MINFGLTLIGRGNWTGGETYLRNMLGVIASRLDGKVAAKLFVSPEQAEKIGASLDPFLAVPPIVAPIMARAGRGGPLVRSLVTGRDGEVARLFAAHGIDVAFESATFYGRRFAVPTVSWIPDFQHRHMPHLFSKSAWWRRDAGFQLQTRAHRVIMLSSEDARADCERFYPASRGKTAVVRFAIDIDPAEHLSRVAEVRSTYDLPQRFFYLPNQFWAHKNHGAVVDALIALRRSGRLDQTMPIVLTGLDKDPRDPGYFERLAGRIEAEQVGTHFRYLGLVPYRDVFALNAAADTLVNPSFFEGWSTTVEEAKALGTRLLLSSLGVHREQAPDATFFAADDSVALADKLHTMSLGPAHVRPSIGTLAADQASRRQDYADALLAALEKAKAMFSR